METTDEEVSRKSKRNAKKCAEIGRILVKEEVKARVKQVSDILKKSESARTEADNAILQQSPEIVQSIGKRRKSRDAAKQRLLEVEDEPEILKSKCQQLARELKDCKQVVVYTGAGISTAASIPDYRGPNGVWTLLQQGKEVQAQDLSDAEPTLTHMAIAKLHYENMVKHVVSQNCDGLHLRSGLSRNALSEVHGNMFIELCKECKPLREYIRLFDVTERTGVRRHSTGRSCHMCGSPLKDTIVHFGEKGGLQSPYNWQEAADAVDDCDMILCLGSSLKILRKYPCLWCMDMRPKDRPKLYIVNLQWTPKDDFATLKINGKCDEVLKLLMEELNIDIPEYKRVADPIFKLYTPLLKTELSLTSKKILQIPDQLEPNQFSQAVKAFTKKKKMTNKKVPASSVYKTIKCLLEKDQGSSLKFVESTNVSGIEETSSSSNMDVEKKPPCPEKRAEKSNRQSKIKSEHPVLFSRLDLSTASGHNLHVDLSKTMVSVCEQCCGSTSFGNLQKCTCSSEKTVDTSKDEEGLNLDVSDGGYSQIPNSDHMYSSMSNFGVEKEEIKDSVHEDECQVIAQMHSDSKTPISPVTSLPGWFGKGCNPRKRKRKL
ncbi:NAD-dependent protein deacetylase sirtuin-7-like [Liolophura sinensis]|uniref:NAD-dependent protein deacetylase sirtuin-7-like n=1 Tax=Liolophura sinensis TaxID=3198878 RepID=UPI0031589287